jgi:hypothetical protein
MLGQKGHNRDHRPDLEQMIVGAVIDDGGSLSFVRCGLVIPAVSTH